jgi:hypothetical protein
MNFTAQKASRKWANGAFGRIAAAMVTVAATCLLLGMPTAPAYAKKGCCAAPWDILFRDASPRSRGKVGKVRRAAVPLPMPRPAEAPAAEPEQEQAASRNDKSGDQPKDQPRDQPKDQPKDQSKDQAAPAAQPTPQPSACRLALTDAIAIAPSIPDIHGAGGCGGEDLVRLEAIVLPDKRQVSVKPAAILRCPMASALAEWIRNDIAPLAAGLGSAISNLDNFDSYECRGRNRVAGARLSEHGRANALDVRAFRLANGRAVSLTDRTVPREVRESVLHSACTRFPTVLGPGSDGYHEDHIHLDLMERRGNYRICQWNVWDPLPQIAPLLPAERPDEAPPREVAAKSEADKSEARKPAADKAGAAKSDDEKAEEAEPVREEKPATKKRRQNRRS